MTTLLRRVTKLEGCFPPIIPPDPNREFQLLALLKLPMHELELLRGMLLRNESAIPLDDAEEEAIQHCNAAWPRRQPS